MPSREEQTIITATKPMAKALEAIGAALLESNVLTSGRLIERRLTMARDVAEMHTRCESVLATPADRNVLESMEREALEFDLTYPAVAARARQIRSLVEPFEPEQITVDAEPQE